jgi:hypothetical protein
MDEARISELLDDKETISFGVRVPKKSLDRIFAAFKKLSGGTVRGNPKGPALVYFAVRGLLAWEEQQMGKKIPSTSDLSRQPDRPALGGGRP